VHVPEPVPADPGPGAGPAGGTGEPEGPWWEDGWEEDPVPDHRPLAQILAECREAAGSQARDDAIIAGGPDGAQLVRDAVRIPVKEY
jgi:hypothetical protein